MKINFSQGFSKKVFLYLLITFANSFDPDQAENVRPDLDPNFMTPRWYLEKSSIQRVKYGTILKPEEIIKALFENPKADQNTLFCKYLILEPPKLYF